MNDSSEFHTKIGQAKVMVIDQHNHDNKNMIHSIIIFFNIPASSTLNIEHQIFMLSF